MTTTTKTTDLTTLLAEHAADQALYNRTRAKSARTAIAARMADRQAQMEILSQPAIKDDEFVMPAAQCPMCGAQTSQNSYGVCCVKTGCDWSQRMQDKFFALFQAQQAKPVAKPDTKAPEAPKTTIKQRLLRNAAILARGAAAKVVDTDDLTAATRKDPEAAAYLASRSESRVKVLCAEATRVLRTL